MCLVGDPGHAGRHAVPSASLSSRPKLRFYMTPGVHALASSEEARHWTVGARAVASTTLEARLPFIPRP
eukprot:6190559-Pleurochrysis_carterae.AAC.3